MKFFFDENFPKAAAQLLGARGHEWADIRGTDQEGSPDTTIFRLAQQQGAIFLTTDRDFFHTVPHLEKSHYGVVVVALRQPNRRSILTRLEWFLDRFGDTDIDNKVIELRDRTYVVFPNPAVDQLR
jgi:predicted nuclease of predicted toxin-antitoxin system